MLISELENKLKEIREKHGDMPASIFGERLQAEWINIERNFKMDDDDSIVEKIALDIWKT
jgi:hypothetical protein